MNNSHGYHLYCHLVWGTWNRLPVIESSIEGPIYAAIRKKCADLEATAIAIGGTKNHVHLLIRYQPKHRISDLVKEIKGYSSHLVTHTLRSSEFFKWQTGYGAFSVGKTELVRINNYITSQKQHHWHQTLLSDFELNDVYC